MIYRQIYAPLGWLCWLVLAMQARLSALDARLQARLAPLRSRPFLVFHDAFQYFERHYGLTAVGSLVLEPGESPSAARMLEVRQKIRESGAICLFQEPQYTGTLIDTALEGSASMRRGTLDALGQGDYFALLQGLADGFADCLSEEASHRVSRP